MELNFLAISKKSVYSLLLLLFIVLTFTGIFRSDAQAVLHPDELQALRSISRKLGITQWNVTPSSCATGQGFQMTGQHSESLSNVTCDCTFNASTICHVTHIQLNRLSLVGDLPYDFANLPFLSEINLNRNFLTGSIPASWASLPLVILSMIGNLINGTIPREIGSISTLEELFLQDNNMTGPLPRELGSLRRLRRALLSGNNFMGVLPKTFADLTNLTDFRIDGTGITGRIPDFIGKWTKLNRLDMQGTNMEGPIPSNISLLTNLTELRISDLNVSSMAFPDLRELTKMKKLILRSCSITGPIPSYIGEKMLMIENLDLSFNRLTGVIPGTLGSLTELEFMYLTNNTLTGQISQWLSETKDNFDISYNNFTGTAQSSCRESSLNKISSFPSQPDNSIDWCLKKGLPCPGKSNYYNLFVNCGGPRLSYDGEQYEQDLNGMGASSFFFTDKWACSTTGHYLGDEGRPAFRVQTYTGDSAENLYSTARIAPFSLKYYGRCLQQGSYNVKLHFAEIMFTVDQRNNTLGRRIFDIYIQGERIWKDFNIAEEAGGVGVGKNVVKEHTANVTGSTLEIHLYWAGKGTMAVPDRGIYGPLISAISVKPNFKQPSTGLSAGTIAGIVVGSFVAVLLVLAVLWKLGYLGGKDLEDKELLGIQNLPNTFNYAELRTATEDFNSTNKLGEGGFGPVYKGMLSDGREVAVKKLLVTSHQGKSQFIAEISTISAVQHRNLVKLYGCCIEGANRLLVYEYLKNKSLDQALFGKNDLHLNWPTRYSICLGVARGLAYLHEESNPRIVHRDVKASNILLNIDLSPKISDFGLAKLYDDKKTHISTRVAGTIGYLAPEYAMLGHLTEKADVFGFGVVALEILCGRPNSVTNLEPGRIFLLEWAWNLYENNRGLELVDPTLLSFHEDEAIRMLGIALLCTQASPMIRPSMSRVVAMLTGDIQVSNVASKPSYLTDLQFNDMSTFVSDDGTSGSFTSNAPTSQLDSSSNASMAFGADTPKAVTRPMLHEVIGEGGVCLSS